MSRPAVLTVAARDDLRAELRWIGPDNMAKARALRDAVLVAARRLGERPMLGRAQPELLQPPYRFWSLTRFQLVLVYNAGVSPPRILRMLSTARDFGPLLLGIGDPSGE
ncbi:MAG: type II toxin-antitoxin system RelE/ParE family toxin [Pseudomonadota bacterium]|nr:type II toxin-antitoxin system RelE/ParE family toxin [Pseudomonadota bacterium]